MLFTYHIKIIYISLVKMLHGRFFSNIHGLQVRFLKNLLFGGVDIPFADDNLEHDLFGVKEKFQ